VEQPRRGRRIVLIGAAAVLIAVLGIRGVPGLGDGATAPSGEPNVSRIVAEDDHVVAEVLNGTTRRGLARLVTRLLRQGGIDVVYFGTATAPEAAGTEILVRRGDDTAMAVRVARALGAGKVRIAPAPERRVDLTIVIGKDYEPPPTSHP
jgi:hypothetical protein